MRNCLNGRYRIVGAPVRDTEPRKSDISAACSKIKISGGALALYAIYLPVSVEQSAGMLAGGSDG